MKTFLFLILCSRPAIYLFLGFHIGRPSYRRSLQPSKENIQHFKNFNLLTFLNFCWSFLPSWIRNANPDQLLKNSQTSFCYRIMLKGKDDPEMKSLTVYRSTITVPICTDQDLPIKQKNKKKNPEFWSFCDIRTA
jgi:hypothetical protein